MIIDSSTEKRKHKNINKSVNKNISLQTRIHNQCPVRAKFSPYKIQPVSHARFIIHKMTLGLLTASHLPPTGQNAPRVSSTNLTLTPGGRLLGLLGRDHTVGRRDAELLVYTTLLDHLYQDNCPTMSLNISVLNRDRYIDRYIVFADENDNSRGIREGLSKSR
ncbi:hypothetical protein QJS04_geneDACA022307 [Acorus gramineus]|uniref:Uncharacterized protein n=1 Tax=Acorus gramineus TaxID=55184 RepID=A0AAV9B7S9_ACOGR|nr:hypothetical protein QJS04_geneDACA022307 [Acorus gramineus]